MMLEVSEKNFYNEMCILKYCMRPTAWRKRVKKTGIEREREYSFFLYGKRGAYEFYRIYCYLTSYDDNTVIIVNM